MDFFKTVFSDEPRNEEGESGEENASPNPDSPPAVTEQSAGVSGWDFGALIKTITARSEQVIETYRRDLDEFRVGLTQEARFVAASLPASLENGASVAQESLESVGEAIDVVFKSTADLISQALESPSSAAAPSGSNSGAKKFTRFEMQLHAIQNDYNTYCEDPDDVEEFNKWRSGFSIEEKADEVVELCEDKSTVGGLFTKLVPKSVDAESFWARYFFRAHKLKLVEEARAHLVKRVISGEEDEDLSWDVEDDESFEPSASQKDEVNDIKGVAGNCVGLRDDLLIGGTAIEATSEKSETMSSALPRQTNEKSDSLVEIEVPKAQTVPNSHENSKFSDEIGDKSNASREVKDIPDEKTLATPKRDSVESSKNSHVSVVFSQASGHEEEDVGWDEIEDLGSSHGDMKTIISGGRPNKSDIQKRLSGVDDDDLSWDIEDEEDAKP